MTTDPELTRIVRSWLAEGVTDVPDRVLDSVMTELPATPQRRRWPPAWRDFSMNGYVRAAAAVAVVTILVVGGISVLRPSLIGGPATPTPTPATSPTSSPSELLPLAPAAWCEYVELRAAIVPEGPTYAALEAARGGDLAEWKRLGPEILVLAQEVRSTLAKMEGPGPITQAVGQEASALDGWIDALEASLAESAGVPEITRIYSTYDDWQANRGAFINAMGTNYETACP